MNDNEEDAAYELKKWRDYFGCDSPHDVYLASSSTDHMVAAKEQERANRLAHENTRLRKIIEGRAN